MPWFFSAEGYESPGYVWATFMLGLTAVVILALWFFPRIIAGKILPPVETGPRPSAGPDVWLGVGCTLLGLWILTTTIPPLMIDLFALNSASTVGDRSELLHSMLYFLPSIAIAIWLILGAKGVRKIFRWAQDVGVRKDL